MHPPDAHASPGRVVGLVVLFAGVHSFLASRWAKDAAARLVGERVRNGWYRAGFVAHATWMTGWAIRQFVKLPDRELYHVRGPGALALRGVQVGALALLGWAVAIVRLPRITGTAQVQAFAHGGKVPPEMAAQGPTPTADSQAMDARGPFRAIRHPDNLPIILLAWTFPRMTVNRLTLAILASAYAVLGSWHEDTRLRAAHGRVWEEWARRTPSLVPGGRGWRG